MARDTGISQSCDEGWGHEPRCRGCDCECHTARARRTNTSRHGDDIVMGDQYNPTCVGSAIRHGVRPAHFES